MPIEAVGFVEAARPHAADDFWGGEEACITLTERFTAEALQGLSNFSHVEVLFLFHEVEPLQIVTGARHPRNNKAWPAVGIFAQRGKNRPNRIGSTICRVVRIEATRLFVTELDAIQGTPVLDIKPVMVEFLPRQEVLQPAWSHELMREYWLRSSTALMTSASAHYATHLAPVYVWMAGGIEAALKTGTDEVAEFLNTKGIAVDLGAGFGMHAIPLARAGWSVLAVDSSAHLLGVLREHTGPLNVRTVAADLLDFRAHLDGQADLVLCMGDTLTHLPTPAEVEHLFAEVAAALAPGGRLVMTLRDYTRLPAGNARFIPMRADADRILTCFLEELPEHVLVHDILHERDGTAWQMKVSSYRKLRLSPAWIAAALARAGLSATIGAGARGMMKVTAVRT